MKAHGHAMPEVDSSFTIFETKSKALVSRIPMPSVSNLGVMAKTFSGGPNPTRSDPRGVAQQKSATELARRASGRRYPRGGGPLPVSL